MWVLHLKWQLKHLLSSMMASCLAQSLTYKMEVTHHSQVYPEYQQTTWHCIPEENCSQIPIQTKLIKLKHTLCFTCPTSLFKMWKHFKRFQNKQNVNFY